MAIKAFLVQNLSLVALLVLEIRKNFPRKKETESSNAAIYPRKTGLTLKSEFLCSELFFSTQN